MSRKKQPDIYTLVMPVIREEFPPNSVCTKGVLTAWGIPPSRTGDERPGRRLSWRARMHTTAGLLCAFVLLSSAPGRAQVPEEDRDFYLKEVLKGETGSIRSLLVDSHETLWIGSQAGLFFLREEGVVRADGEDRAGMVNALLESQGTVWAGGEKGLFRVGRDGMRRVPGDETRLIYALSESGGSLWLGARNGLFRVADGTVGKHTDAKTGAVTALLEDGVTLWVGTNGLLMQKAGRLEPVKGVETGWVRALLRSGSDLWIGADEGVFRVVDERSVRVEGDRTGRVYALEATPGGKVRIGAFNGLFAVEDDRVLYKGSDDVKGILSLHADGDTLWIGALRGLFRWRAGEVVPVPGEPTGWVGTLLTNGETLWIGAEKGLFRLRDGKTVRVDTPVEHSSQH